MHNETGGYQPSEEEIKSAEESMTPEQRKMTYEREHESGLTDALRELREIGEVGYWDRTVDLAGELAALAIKEEGNVVKRINSDTNFSSDHHTMTSMDEERRLGMFREFKYAMDSLKGQWGNKFEPAERGEKWQKEGEKEKWPRDAVHRDYDRSNYRLFGKWGPDSMRSGEMSRSQVMLPYFVMEQIKPQLTPEAKRTMELIDLKEELEGYTNRVKNAEEIIQRMQEDIQHEQSKIVETTEKIERIGIDPRNPALFTESEAPVNE